MPRIALTRESGLNDKLESSIRSLFLKHISIDDADLHFLELPAVEFAPGPDLPQLSKLWDDGEYDSVS
jgi:hypothetical protein